MKHYRVLILACTLALASCTSAMAQHFSLGTWQGPKGLGLSTHVPHENGTFNSYILALDFEQMLNRESKVPGLSFSYAHLLPALPLQSSQAHTMFLYYGPGFMMGIVHDVTGSYGLAACMSGVGGLRAVFDHNIEICLEFRADLGVHLTYDSQRVALNSEFYKSGIFRAYMPQVKIHYLF